MKALFTVLSLSVSSLAMAAPDADLLVGTWNCGASETSAQGSMEIDGTVEYKADKSANYDMTMSMDLTELGESFTIAMSGTGTWRLEGDKLVSTAESMDVSNAGEPSEFVDMMMPQFKAQQQAQLGKETRSTIVELTENKLVERPADGSDTVECTR
ncbi:lipocalin family protein [Saccharospirillum salsuginis]|uniref:Uncharacterized protein n=1 Tax=Saccharospirillum salsuginis TaxID=418750 RepID=A0A918KSE9_9GAMM|nr:lipocalin family protein [Saccharospirillum salsuginis]GGX71503.1 hypothetical protein GCM10007392_43790 [Saccharospirillum salsuginis]